MGTTSQKWDGGKNRKAFYIFMMKNLKHELHALCLFQAPYL